MTLATATTAIPEYRPRGRRRLDDDAARRADLRVGYDWFVRRHTMVDMLRLHPTLSRATIYRIVDRLKRSTDPEAIALRRMADLVEPEDD